MKNILEQFTGVYSLNKTLRFELRPIGKTLEYIDKKGFIAQDEQKADEYKIVKNIIDRYHKAFIRMCLEHFKLKISSDQSYDSLEEYAELASSLERNEKEEKAFNKVKENLRKQIASAFINNSSYKYLFKKELIQNHLPEFVKNENEKQMINKFSKFTTYFSGFHKNRENIYSDKEKSTAIAYRLIHENLPLFLENIKSFAQIAKSEVAAHFVEIETAYREYLNVEHISELFTLDYFSTVLTQEQIEVYNNQISGHVNEDGTKIQGLNEYVNLYNQQQKDHSKRLPLLKPLYKMILSDHIVISWLPEEFKSDEEMIEAINNMHDELKDILSGHNEGSLKSLLQNIGQYDLSKIYIANGQSLTFISQQIFGQYDVLTNEIKKDLRKSIIPTKKEKADSELYETRVNKIFTLKKKFQHSVSE